jgi:hypothetical protein
MADSSSALQAEPAVAIDAGNFYVSWTQFDAWTGVDFTSPFPGFAFRTSFPPLAVVNGTDEDPAPPMGKSFWLPLRRGNPSAGRSFGTRMSRFASRLSGSYTAQQTIHHSPVYVRRQLPQSREVHSPQGGARGRERSPAAQFCGRKGSARRIPRSAAAEADAQDCAWRVFRNVA